MTSLGDFPKELAHVEVLAKAAHSITLVGKDEQPSLMQRGRL